jgi:hypothetical protein
MAQGFDCYWLTFHDAAQFLGAVIIEALSEEDAVLAAQRLACDPGGDHVAVVGFHLATAPAHLREAPRGVLLSRSDVKSILGA